LFFKHRATIIPGQAPKSKSNDKASLLPFSLSTQIVEENRKLTPNITKTIFQKLRKTILRPKFNTTAEINTPIE